MIQYNYTRVFVEIDLDAVIDNMEAMKGNLSEQTGFIGVVKTDGYGHGAVPVAKAIEPYVWGYAVAAVEEAVILKNHGISKPILILGSVHPSRYETVIRHQIRTSIFQLEKAQLLSAKAMELGMEAVIHLALDTGMSRIGMVPGAAALEEAEAISKLSGIRIEGMFTHFAKADETKKESAMLQLKQYQEFAAALEMRGIHIPIKHCSNSAGIIDLREANLDLVRAGISIYGLYPSDEVDKTAVPLRPAMALKSYVNYIKTVEEGTYVSYGGTFKTRKRTVIATIPVGYGDGYPRNLSGIGAVLIRGKRAPILGRVCMDQFMVDVTEIPGVVEEDVATLVGRDGEEEITVEELAAKGGGFHYEIICDIGKRVPRVYLRGKKVVGTKNYFDDIYQDFLT